MILVTAAAGNQGKHLVPLLVAAGHHVRACVQSNASAELLRSRGVHEVIVGDLSDPAVATRAITARYSSHDFVGNPNVLRWLLGREPTTFEAFVHREYTRHQQAQPT